MKGGWDCHAHLFGPYGCYPLAADRSYTPPEAPVAQYLALLRGMGLSHGVLVQPSAYGEDHGLLFDILAAYPALRGVVVMRQGASKLLRGLRSKGVRAARFSHRPGAGANFRGSASFEDLLQMSGALADAGLHAELWTDCASLPAIAAQLKALPVPVVIDHMGGFDVTASPDDPGFRCLLALLEHGQAWVKLCLYRNVPGMTDLEAGRPFHDELVKANPQRLLWGSDWPHLRVNPQPDAAHLLQTFKHWVGDVGVIDSILTGNPESLYG
ncbi:amidohydrolase family protein [Variovorax terrae]|uniref:Amidohydrolase family protein n=1 Tax=Variovorax terrae TaxID=2923278 RepID=A0A9X1VTI7_9BURK|nr:amidohydrolase family protein [Variovorax terrae]